MTILKDKSADECYNLGIQYCEEGKFDLSINEFTQAIQLCPLDLDAYRNRAIAHIFLGKFEFALSDYEEMLMEMSVNNCDKDEVIEDFLFASSLAVKIKDYDKAREFVNYAFLDISDKNQQHKNIYLENINNAEELDKKNQQLKSEIKQKESLQNRMQKLVQQFTHSLGNVIFPDTIYQVAERLKNLPECRRDTLLLHEAYHAEIIIKLQAELLRHRYGNKEPESFRNMIRKCRRNANSSDKKSIEDILNYAVSRATARFLNQHYAGLETIRNKILSQNNTELNQLKQKFEDDILLHNCLSPMEWVSQNLRPIQITQFSPLWKKIGILADSYAEALLFGYFSEILFNALKYADHDNKEFLTLSFTETNINDNVYLLSNWSNPTTKQKLPELGTNKGLEAIAEDLKQLNGTENPEQSLLISQQANQFQVTLFFKKDLLIDESNILKIKRPVHLVE